MSSFLTPVSQLHTVHPIPLYTMFASLITSLMSDSTNITYLDVIITESIFDSEFDLFPGFKTKLDGTHEDILDHVENGLPPESPLSYGMHPVCCSRPGPCLMHLSLNDFVTVTFYQHNAYNITGINVRMRSSVLSELKPKLFSHTDTPPYTNSFDSPFRTPKSTFS